MPTGKLRFQTNQTGPRNIQRKRIPRYSRVSHRRFSRRLNHSSFHCECNFVPGIITFPAVQRCTVLVVGGSLSSTGIEIPAGSTIETRLPSRRFDRHRDRVPSTKIDGIEPWSRIYRAGGSSIFPTSTLLCLSECGGVLMPGSGSIRSEPGRVTNSQRSRRTVAGIKLANGRKKLPAR